MNSLELGLDILNSTKLLGRQFSLEIIRLVKELANNGDEHCNRANGN